MKRSRRIVVAGFAVGFPLGGQVWMMLHFMAGLARLGHEVLFVEDTSNWAIPSIRCWLSTSDSTRDGHPGHAVPTARPGRTLGLRSQIENQVFAWTAALDRDRPALIFS